jgi:hypothetical protein
MGFGYIFITKSCTWFLPHLDFAFDFPNFGLSFCNNSVPKPVFCRSMNNQKIIP